MEGLLFQHTHFISQLASEIRCKLQRLEDGPQIPQRELLSAAFKVFNNRDEETKKMNNLKGIRLNARCSQQLFRAPTEIYKALRAKPLKPLQDPA